MPNLDACFVQGEHWSRDCENNNNTTKCTNCNEPHLANDENCKVYQQRIEKIQENNSNNNNTKKNTQQQTPLHQKMMKQTFRRSQINQLQQ